MEAFLRLMMVAGMRYLAVQVAEVLIAVVLVVLVEPAFLLETAAMLMQIPVGRLVDLVQMVLSLAVVAVVQKTAQEAAVAMVSAGC